nr:hypothetical protein [uncultured Oscillibacter sp.]
MDEFMKCFMKMCVAFSVIVGVLLIGIAVLLFLRPAIFWEIIKFSAAFLCLTVGLWLIGSLLAAVFQKQ